MHYEEYMVIEAQVTFPLLLPATPVYRRTSYISPPATTPWLRKDKLHFPSSYHTHLSTEGRVTFTLQLQPPSDYGRASYIYHSATASTGLQKDKLHFPSSYHTHLVMEGQVIFSLLLHHPLIAEVTVKPWCIPVGQNWPPISSW